MFQVYVFNTFFVISSSILLYAIVLYLPGHLAMMLSNLLSIVVLSGGTDDPALSDSLSGPASSWWWLWCCEGALKFPTLSDSLSRPASSWRLRNLLSTVVVSGGDRRSHALLGPASHDIEQSAVYLSTVKGHWWPQALGLCLFMMLSNLLSIFVLSWGTDDPALSDSLSGPASSWRLSDIPQIRDLWQNFVISLLLRQGSI